MRWYRLRAFSVVVWLGALALGSLVWSCASAEDPSGSGWPFMHVRPGWLGDDDEDSAQQVEDDGAISIAEGSDSVFDSVADDPGDGSMVLISPDDPLIKDARIRGTQWPMVANRGASYAYEAEDGIASYYTDHKVATGEYYDSNALTAAHRTLPFGTIVRCTRLDTGQSVVVMINDRGPFVDGRILDLSRAAARKIQMIDDGVVRCRMEVLAYPLILTMGPRGNG